MNKQIGIIFTLLLFSTGVAFSCAHNFEGPVNNIGYVFHEGNTMFVKQLVAGKSSLDHAVKIYIIEKNTKVNFIELGSDSEKLKIFTTLERKARGLLGRGLRSTSKVSNQITQEFDHFTLNYESITRDVCQGSEEINCDELFSYIQNKYNFDSSHIDSMNASLSQAAAMNHVVLVVKAQRKEEAEDSDGFAMALELKTEIPKGFSGDRLKQEFFDRVFGLTMMNFDISQGTKGLSAMFIWDYNSAEVEKGWNSSTKFHGKYNGPRNTIDKRVNMMPPAGLGSSESGGFRISNDGNNQCTYSPNPTAPKQCYKASSSDLFTIFAETPVSVKAKDPEWSWFQDRTYTTQINGREISDKDLAEEARKVAKPFIDYNEKFLKANGNSGSHYSFSIPIGGTFLHQIVE